MAAPVPVFNTEACNTAARTLRAIHQPFASDTTILAASDGTPVVALAKTGYTIYVIRIAIAITTDAAQTLIFKDSAGTPVVIAALKASPGIGPYLFDFGEMGTPLTESTRLDLAISAAGLAARVHVEGYYKRTTVGAP